MQFIPAKERYSQHAKTLSCESQLLSDVVLRYGHPSMDWQFTRLAGGFMNANYLASAKDQRFVVRLYSTDGDTATRECDLLKYVASHGVLVPKVFDTFQVENRPIAILEFVDGITLEDRLLSGESMRSTFFADIGKQLGQIHRITFAKAGFIRPQLDIGGEYENFAAFLKPFIEGTLSMLLTRPERLSEALNRRLMRLVRDKWSLVSATEPRRQLVHCDFNPKNLLVSRGAAVELLAVIDWEFCLSGNGLGDVGNFFRFEYDYPPGARANFVAGYATAADGDLPDNWMDVAKLLDIGNMCSFLERPEDYQESFRTARTVIQSTLEHFGY